MGKEPHTHNCSHELSTWEFEFFLGLRRLYDNLIVERLWQAPCQNPKLPHGGRFRNVESLSSCIVIPKTIMGFSTFSHFCSIPHEYHTLGSITLHMNIGEVVVKV